MPVEIREIVLQARLIDEQRPDHEYAFDPSELREQILAECDRKIRAALSRRAER